MLHFSSRRFLRQNRNVFLEKLPLIQNSSLKKRMCGKNAAAGSSSSLNYQKGFFIHIYKMEESLPLPLAFSTYTSQVHGFLQNIKDSQFQIKNQMSPKHGPWFAAGCDWHITIFQIRSKNFFLFEILSLWEKRWRCQSCCRMRMKWYYLLM